MNTNPPTRPSHLRLGIQGLLVAMIIGCGANAWAQASQQTDSLEPGPQDPPRPATWSLSDPQSDGDTTALDIALDTRMPSIPPELHTQFREALFHLAHPDWPQRHAAADELAAMRININVLESLIHLRALSIEQKNQLINIICYRILTDEAGAIGITMAINAPPEIGVFISQVQPGMPAQDLLEAGDRITHINDRLVMNSGRLQDVIAAYRPGDTIAIRFLRAAPSTEPPQQRPDQPGPVKTQFVEHEVALTLGNAVNLGSDHMSGIEVARRARVTLLRNEATLSIRVERPEVPLAIDSHPAIAELKIQRDSPELDDPQRRQEILRNWKATFQSLRDAINEPDIAPSERAHRLAVFERYGKLIPERFALRW